MVRTAAARDRMGMSNYAVLVVDDHQAVRMGVKALLEDEPEVAAVETAATSEGALAVAERMSPDVAVVDFHLPDRDGLTLTRQLKTSPEPPRVLIYSAYADQRLELAALVAGADGILSKAVLGTELCDRVNALAHSPSGCLSVSAATLAAASHQIDIDDRPILGLLAAGTPPDEIATVLAVSEEWLEARRWAMLKCLRAGPRTRRAKPYSLGGPYSG
jgi:two-component system, NarL family, response regulator DevR